jgi:hypothetical protein
MDQHLHFVGVEYFNRYDQKKIKYLYHDHPVLVEEKLMMKNNRENLEDHFVDRFDQQE